MGGKRNNQGGNPEASMKVWFPVSAAAREDSRGWRETG